MGRACCGVMIVEEQPNIVRQTVLPGQNHSIEIVIIINNNNNNNNNNNHHHIINK